MTKAKINLLRIESEDKKDWTIVCSAESVMSFLLSILNTRIYLFLDSNLDVAFVESLIKILAKKYFHKKCKLLSLVATYWCGINN